MRQFRMNRREHNTFVCAYHNEALKNMIIFKTTTGEIQYFT